LRTPISCRSSAGKRSRRSGLATG